MTSTTDVTVEYHVVDHLPGDMPALFAATGTHLDVTLSRAATVDEIAAALGRMRDALACSVFELRPVA